MYAVDNFIRSYNITDWPYLKYIMAIYYLSVMILVKRNRAAHSWHKTLRDYKATSNREWNFIHSQWTSRILQKTDNSSCAINTSLKCNYMSVTMANKGPAYGLSRQCQLKVCGNYDNFISMISRYDCMTVGHSHYISMHVAQIIIYKLVFMP